jgi:hypothetical protein
MTKKSRVIPTNIFKDFMVEQEHARHIFRHIIEGHLRTIRIGDRFIEFVTNYDIDEGFAKLYEVLSYTVEYDIGTTVEAFNDPNSDELVVKMWRLRAS